MHLYVYFLFMVVLFDYLFVFDIIFVVIQFIKKVLR